MGLVVARHIFITSVMHQKKYIVGIIIHKYLSTVHTALTILEAVVRD